MEEKARYHISWRGILKLGMAAGASVAATAGLPQATLAHDLKPVDPTYEWDRYEEIVNRPVIFRQLYQWPNILNPITFGNIRNGINGFQFSYGVPAAAIQVVVQAYASANAATYDDYIWEKYKWGEALKVDDPTTKKPATRNIFYPSSLKASDVTPTPTDRNHAYYNDMSMEGLQRRGVLFLCWHQTLHAHASSAYTTQNPDKKTVDQIVTEMMAHLVRDTLMIPAAVGELVRLQDKGFRLVVNS